MGLLQSGICRAVHRVTDVGKIPVQISKDEADEQQAHSMIPKTERYPETSVNKAKTKSLIRMHSKGCEQETQMPVAKKERPTHKCWWKMKNGCPNHSSKQLTPNERKKHSWNHLKTPKRLPTCKHMVEKTHTKTHLKITKV